MAPRPRGLVIALAACVVFAACGRGATTSAPILGGGATPSVSAPGSATPAVTPAASIPAATPGTTNPPAADDLLAIVKARGKILMSTDPDYAPQSSITPQNTYEGFDIDVGTEIAKRLGVEIEFVTPGWDVITAGSWGGRWDFSVGSMTITSDREKILSFTQPYYYTPAQMAAREGSGITTLDGLAGKVICVGAATTYFQWLEGTLDFGSSTPETTPPSGATATTLSTDRKCASSWRGGRKDFDGWLSSITTVDKAIKDGLPVVKVGEPVFYEPLAVAVDKSGPPHAEFVAAVDKIVGDMHADGTLTGLSMKWFDFDYTHQIGG